MKKFITIFLVLFMIVFVVASLNPAAASAQIPTPSITPTIKTPTPTPTIRADCPPGLPEGWGTYTPSPLWMVECEVCLNNLTPVSTSTPFPSPTHDGTGTPYPTSTVTPIVTITPTLPLDQPIIFAEDSCTYLTRLGAGQSFGSCELITPYLLTYTMVQDWLPYPAEYQLGLYDTLQRSENVYFDLYFYFINNGEASTSNMQGYSHSYLWQNLGSAYKVGGIVTGSILDGYFYGATNEHGAGIQVSSYFDPNSWGTRNYTAYISLHSEYDPTATPTPLVTPTPYSSYSCTSVSGFDSGFGWEIFSPIGEPNCDMGWDEFGFLEYTVPAVQICLQPVEFGVIRMWGNDFEVGSYGLVAVAAFLIRFLKVI